MAVTAGERRVVSVLVADVAGSTAIGERLGPERSKFLFDEVVRLMSEQVRRYEGTVAQLTGDGLLALFGAPLAHEGDAERAVRAGLAIQQALGKYAEEVEAAYGIRLAARVGVNTGPVVLLSGEEPEEVRYNALGDTVNVAARLQALAGEGGVAVGPATARQVEGRFELEALGELELKGKTAPVATFRVTGVREAVPAAPERPLVGRQLELALLEQILDGLVDGRGAVVSITGEPGIGKTRLVAEGRERYRDRVRFLEGHAVSYAQTFPYWPIRELVRAWLGLGLSAPEARVRLDLKTELSRLLGEEATNAYTFLASLLGLAPEPDVAEGLRELSRDSIQRQTFEAAYELVRALAREQPLCLVLEDLHWADESTLELLEEFLPVTEEEAVGLVFCYRSEREHGSWHLGERARQRYPHRYRELELSPLAPDASRALAGSAAGAELPEQVSELLAERSGGNPFFLEEALRDLVERGALRREDGRFELAVGVDELAVPELVQEALQARLDRLEPQTRDVLSVAAVIGRSFGLPLLERLAPRERLVPALSELQRLELVVEERRRPAPEYRFRHGLVQEVAHANLVEGRRRELHLRVGEALEDLYRDSPEEVYGLVARHFSEGDEPERAVEYLLRAGDAARALYAEQEALEHYRKALAFMQRPGEEDRARKTLFKIALTHHLAFDFERAERAYEEAFSRRVEEPLRLEPTERIETGMPHPDELGPGHTYGTVGAVFVEHLFRGLLRVDRELNVVPELAESFGISSDGRSYRFRLRRGARWSDGVPLTAEDFAFAWRRMREERTATAFLLEDVETAEALDERTLEVRLREPRSYFPYILAQQFSFPWPRHRYEQLGEDWRRPEHLVGNGPFVLAEYDDEHALLVASPEWVGPRGNVREIRFSFNLSGEEEVEAWRAGRFDVLLTGRREAREAPDTVAEIVPELATWYLGFRADAPPFDDELARKAFSHALDRERFVAAGAYVAQPAIRGGLIPPAMPGHSHRAGPEYDLELARRLLAEAGYPDGRGLPELELFVPEGFVFRDAAASLAEQWAEQWAALGAQVTVTFAPLPSLGAAVRERGHLWSSGWKADYPDPDGMVHTLFENREPLYRDEEIKSLLVRARSIRNRDERLRLYREVERLWVSERAALVPLAYSRGVHLRRPWLEGFWKSPLSTATLDQVVVRRG